MIDFASMKYGAIQCTNGDVVIVLNGTFHGPFNEDQRDQLIDMFKNHMKEEQK